MAHVAQLAEHILGKDEVSGSIPLVGSSLWNRVGLDNEQERTRRGAMAGLIRPVRVTVKEKNDGQGKI